jgi:BolA family transcriptional regulator, general stress-responsive regulator
MRMLQRIERKLRESFAPRSLTITDDSRKHQGHSGWREEGETHFSVAIVSDAFLGKSRVDRHRLINVALAEEFADGVHALAISARTPSEV